MTDLIHVWKTDLSDYYKEAFGVRPRHYKEWWTKDELEAEYDHLERVCAENERVRVEVEKESYKRFEKLIAEVIAYGAGNRETAIRWLIEADETIDINWKQDVEHFFWSLGISYEKSAEYMKQY
jgi:hypothetical protein